MLVALPTTIHGHQAHLIGCLVIGLYLVGGIFTLDPIYFRLM